MSKAIQLLKIYIYEDPQSSMIRPRKRSTIIVVKTLRKDAERVIARVGLWWARSVNSFK